MSARTIRPADPKRHHLTALDRRHLRALWEFLDDSDAQTFSPRNSYTLTDRVPALGTATLVIVSPDGVYRVPVVGAPA